MSAFDALRNFLLPLLAPPQWRIQMGNWYDDIKTVRYAVIRPLGGLPVELIREYQFNLMLVAAENESWNVLQDAAEAIIAEMRQNSGQTVFLQPAEPVYQMTKDNRHFLEMAISAITV